MSTYRELVYIVLDEMKLHSDDTSFNEDHVIFLLNKNRALLLKQRYSDTRKAIPASNYQTVCLDVIEVPAIPDGPCEDSSYLRSAQKVPNIIGIVGPEIYPVNYYEGDITFISRERMKYVGYNKYMQNIIYASMGPDNYIYFTSFNPHYKYLDKVKVTAVFEDPSIVTELECKESGSKEVCDVLDSSFPIEEGLMTELVSMTVKELSMDIYRPEDSNNNAEDDLSKVQVGNGRRA